MYRGFNLVGRQFSTNGSEAGQQIYTKTRRTVRQTLESLFRNGRIDGKKITERWFPQTAVEVFISHSHSDTADAIKLAGWLKNAFGINSFVDSCAWGYADDLLKEIDDEHCFNSSTNTYSYEKRNNSTSHVHMMLSIALASMLDATECIIFLNTPNSITSKEAVAKTQSPWLYYELGMLRLLRRKSAHEHRSQELLESFAKRAELHVDYPAELATLTVVDTNHLTDWGQRWARASKASHPLDVLYQVAPEQSSSAKG